MSGRDGADWDALMRLGLGRLGLDAGAFWAMTPLEFQRALEGAGIVATGGEAPGREVLRAMMARFPDGKMHGDSGEGGDGDG